MELVEEIILVDDASEQEHLGAELEDYVKNLPLPVFVLRTGVRSGLIRARWDAMFVLWECFARGVLLDLLLLTFSEHCAQNIH